MFSLKIKCQNFPKIKPFDKNQYLSISTQIKTYYPQIKKFPFFRYLLLKFTPHPKPMQIESLKIMDAELFSEFEAIYLKKFNKRMEYGTAGFRTKNQFLDLVSFRTGIIVSILSRLCPEKVLGLMITASHNAIEDNGVKITDFDGGMLRGHLEKELENFVNEKDLEKAIGNLLSYLEKMEDGKKIDMSAEGTAFLGGDTRPHTERLLHLASEGIVLSGGIVRNFGQCTTPMLHFYGNFLIIIIIVKIFMMMMNEGFVSVGGGGGFECTFKFVNLCGGGGGFILGGFSIL